MTRPPISGVPVGEVQAVLKRLQRFSGEPDSAEFQSATPPTAVKARHIAVGALLGAGAMLLIVAGTLGVLGSSRLSGTAMLISAPLAPHQDSRPPAEIPSSGPRSVAVEDKARAERFLLRGEEYLANGNVIAARALFERAAEAGLAAGALRLAATYDPVELQRLQALSVIPDRDLARMWYERARELGAQESVKGLARLGSD